MNKITKIIVFVFTLTTYYFLLTPTAKAVCPVCTVAIVGGLGLSRYLGIDDSASGVWVGGMILSLTFWSINWLEKKGKKFLYKNFVVAGFWYGITLIPLWYSKIIGHPFNTIFGIDKLIFGTIFGSLAFLAGMYLDKAARKKYGKQFFNYQKVVFPVSALAITSLILFIFTSVKIGYGG